MWGEWLWQKWLSYKSHLNIWQLILNLKKYIIFECGLILVMCDMNIFLVIFMQIWELLPRSGFHYLIHVA